MSKQLIELIGSDLASLNVTDGGIEFARKVIAAALDHHIPLESIAELKYADLNGDGKTGEKEIAALISSAHKKRAGSQFLTISSGAGIRDGRAVSNPDYKPTITAEDLKALTDSDVIDEAKQHLQSGRELPSVEQLLNAIGKDTIKVFKEIRGGVEASEGVKVPSDTIRGSLEKSNGIQK